MSVKLKNIKIQILRNIRSYLVKNNRISFFYFLNCQIYKALQFLIIKFYSTIPEISSIYLVHGLALDEIYPGLSDFDLVIVYNSSSNLEFYYNKLRYRWKIIQGVISARDLLLFTEEEFNLWQRYGGGWEPLDELPHWKLLYGKELRQKTLELDSHQANKDRILYSLSKYFSLLNTVIKEEPNSPFLGITVRRNLYKNFCYSVLSMNNKYLSFGSQFTRLTEWIEDNAENSQPMHDLLKIRKSRFQEGNISQLRFSIGAHAYLYIDKTLEKSVPYFNSSFTNISNDKNILPVFNQQEVVNKIKGLTSSIVDLLKNKLLSIMIFSNGSPLGFMLFIILKDNLEIKEIAEIFGTIHVVFRIYDDLWFNEHFPVKVPIIYSKRMFWAHLQVWHLHKINSYHHRYILFGEDLFKFIDEEPDFSIGNIFNDELLKEKINLSRSLHQIILENNKPALYDLITLQYPRYYIFEKTGIVTATVDEAVFYYGKINDHEISNLPKYFFEKYGKKSIHDLSSAISENEFNEAVCFLNEKLADSLTFNKIFKGNKY